MHSESVLVRGRARST